jgi:hypothetical protein
MRAGHSLLELALVTLLAGIIASAATLAVGRGRDVLAVQAARDELIASLALARSHAVRSGGASLIIEPSGTLRVLRNDGVPLAEPLDLVRRYGIFLITPKDGTATIRFDALGIGRMAATTFHIRRGGVSASIVVSAYGRART